MVALATRHLAPYNFGEGDVLTVLAYFAEGGTD
jgi:hypothetical protein